MPIISNLVWQWLGLICCDVAPSCTSTDPDQTHLPLLHRQPRMVWQPCNPCCRKVFQMPPAFPMCHNYDIIQHHIIRKGPNKIIADKTHQIMELFIVYPREPLAIDLKLLGFCKEDTTGVDMLTCNLILPFTS